MEPELLAVARERARLDLPFERFQPPRLVLIQRDIAIGGHGAGMLTLANLLAQEDLGGFPGRRCESLARAVGVAVVHEPDVLLCAGPPSNARHGVRLSCAYPAGAL